MRRLNAAEAGFERAFEGFLSRGAEAAQEAEQAVRPILDAVRREGDAALCRLTERFDGFPLTPEDIPVREEEVEEAHHTLPRKVLAALEEAARRIRRFHEEERPRSWSLEGEGEMLGLWVRPLGRVGLYAPGGKAAYPSTVLMTAIPASVAGVAELVL
ncbi:MAG: histidinol dehydrogenase, partial [Nitrospinota bacterium]